MNAKRKMNLAEYLLAELEDTEAAKELKSVEDEACKPTTLWKCVRGEVESILNGDWNLEDFRTGEMGAAWMLVYLINEIKKNDFPLMLSGGRITLNIIQDVFISFDFRKMLQQEMEIRCPEESLEFLSEIRETIDQIENELKKEIA